MTFLQAHPWTGPDDPSHLDHTVITNSDVVAVACGIAVMILLAIYLPHWSTVRRFTRKYWGYVLAFSFAVLIGLVAGNWDRLSYMMQAPPERHGNGRVYH